MSQTNYQFSEGKRQFAFGRQTHPLHHYAIPDTPSKHGPLPAHRRRDPPITSPRTRSTLRTLLRRIEIAGWLVGFAAIVLANQAVLLWNSHALLAVSAALESAQLAIICGLLWSMPPLVAEISAPRIPQQRRPSV
ncbi:hypothetical protein ACFV4P_31325 [Kitasatospora sp. NPDC059795]|uniref:hypothetical protein n=1 Tax=Kitasatospora sp. NPDC059795 TaxID=3346949 RepID=UPI0036525CFB